ncbi:MAG TPA: M14 family zinc carboxypeptidase [Calditrichia bacterium]|nr:peptidase M14 [Calditrichota bacterium]HQU73070.1 M14 family zinc carboxypeptidase [Calditrichia bacterium]HQV30791.1 M14 family zinc carboxypeptidase [Calditrichia bacterium]
MLDLMIPTTGDKFWESSEINPRIAEACAHSAARVQWREIGRSEAGRPIHACFLGEGTETVLLAAGAHADEPVGPDTLRLLLLSILGNPERFDPLLRRFRLVMVPHVNPDGEARNQTWIEKWPDTEVFLKAVHRELPGRDVEFGYPAMRPENIALAGLIRELAPLRLYVNLHGMAFSDGVMVLIERTWADRSPLLKDGFRELAAAHSWPLHDHDRMGEKGFLYLGAGFTSTPEGRAMAAHFRRLGDEASAARFHLSSMEWVREQGGDPLCLVTEFPLFMVTRGGPGRQPGIPGDYLALKDRLPRWRLDLEKGLSIAGGLSEFGVQSFPRSAAIAGQLRVISLGLRQIGFSGFDVDLSSREG